MNKLHSEIRGPGLISPAASLEYRSLRHGQPLILMREPDNPVDPNAVIVHTVLLQPCGYLAKEHARLVAPEITTGLTWLALVERPAGYRAYPQILLWKERGPSQKFKAMAVRHGASATVAELIIQGKFRAV